MRVVFPTLAAARRSLANDPFVAAQREMDRLFEELVGDRAEGANGASQWQAPWSLWEDDAAYHAELELPGVTSDKLELTVHEGRLAIAAERPAPEGERKYHRQHRRYGRFEWYLTLPEGIDVESIGAELREGVLHLTLRKAPQAQPRKITVTQS